MQKLSQNKLFYPTSADSREEIFPKKPLRGRPEKGCPPGLTLSLQPCGLYHVRQGAAPERFSGIASGTPSPVRTISVKLSCLALRKPGP